MSLNLLLFATAYGFNGALDTHAPVAFGSDDRAELFACLARQLLLLGGLSIFAIFLFLHAESLLLAIGVRTPLAKRTAQLLHLMSMAVPGDFLYDCFARWMRGQQLHRFVSMCSVLALSVNLLVSLLERSPLDPTRGPLMALIAQNTILPVLLVAAYCWAPGGHRTSLLAAWQTRPSAVALFGPPLWRQLRTAMAAMVWTCAELWAWEVQVFAAARLGTGNAAAYTLLSSTYALLISTFPVSLASAAGSLMGEALGLGTPQRARRLLDATCVLALLAVGGYTLPLYLGRASLAAMLCGGVEDVASAYADALPLVLSMHLLDGLFNVFKQWLVVRNRQGFGATMSIVIYYAIGVPAGLYLAFGRGWHLLGLWAGLGVSVALGALAAGVQATLDMAALTESMAEPEAVWTGDGIDYVQADAWFAREKRRNAHTSHLARGGVCVDVCAWCQARTSAFAWLGALLAPGLLAFGALLATSLAPPPSHSA